MTAYLITFLLGALVGAAGTYLGNRFTDQRRAQESAKAVRSAFDEVRSAMPDLIAEMKADLTKGGHGTVREFFVVSKRWAMNVRDPSFFYYLEDHPDLTSKVHVLENRGYVVDVTDANAKRYRMSEDFVKLVVSS